MKKVVCLTLLFVMAFSFVIGTMTASTQAAEGEQCILKCNFNSHTLYECCRFADDPYNKWDCDPIGEC